MGNSIIDGYDELCAETRRRQQLKKGDNICACEACDNAALVTYKHGEHHEHEHCADCHQLCADGEDWCSWLEGCTECGEFKAVAPNPYGDPQCLQCLMAGALAQPARSIIDEYGALCAASRRDAAKVAKVDAEVSELFARLGVPS